MAIDKELCLEILDRAIMQPLKSEFELKAELIANMLDLINPIPKDATDSVKEAIDTERQLLVIRTGWNKMSIKELRKLQNSPVFDKTGLA